MNIDEIERRANAATPGPWMPPTQRERGPGCDDHACVVDHEGCAVWPWHRREDMEFAYAARTDVPALIARVRELEAESAKRKEAFERIRSTNTDLMMQLFDAQERTRAVNISPVLHENAMLKSMVLGLEAELLKRKP